jgi:hypothetical protein
VVVNKFPKIAEGVYHNGTTSTVISEGLEKNCKFPRRFYKKLRISKGVFRKTVPGCGGLDIKWNGPIELLFSQCMED